MQMCMNWCIIQKWMYSVTNTYIISSPAPPIPRECDSLLERQNNPQMSP